MGTADSREHWCGMGNCAAKEGAAKGEGEEGALTVPPPVPAVKNEKTRDVENVRLDRSSKAFEEGGRKFLFDLHVFKLKSLLDGRELDGFLVENAGVQGAAYVAGLRMGDLLYDINSHQCANAGVLSEAMQSNKPVLVKVDSTARTDAAFFAELLPDRAQLKFLQNGAPKGQYEDLLHTARQKASQSYKDILKEFDKKKKECVIPAQLMQVVYRTVSQMVVNVFIRYCTKFEEARYKLGQKPWPPTTADELMSEADMKKAEEDALIDLQQVMGGGEDKELGKVLKRLLEEQILPRRVKHITDVNTLSSDAELYLSRQSKIVAEKMEVFGNEMAKIFSEQLHETIKRFREADEAPVLSAAPMGRSCCAG